MNERDALESLHRAGETGEVTFAPAERELECLRGLLAKEVDPKVRARIERRIAQVTAHPECHDCGSTYHGTGSYHCPAVHQGDSAD